MFEVELLDFQTPVQCSHILLKHTGSRNPVVRATGKAVKRSKDEAIAGITNIREQITSGGADVAATFAQLAFENSECGSSQ